jgi:hypothetical protein
MDHSKDLDDDEVKSATTFFAGDLMDALHVATSSDIKLAFGPMTLKQLEKKDVKGLNPKDKERLEELERKLKAKEEKEQKKKKKVVSKETTLQKLKGKKLESKGKKDNQAETSEHVGPSVAPSSTSAAPSSTTHFTPHESSAVLVPFSSQPTPSTPPMSPGNQLDDNEDNEATPRKVVKKAKLNEDRDSVLTSTDDDNVEEYL